MTIKPWPFNNNRGSDLPYVKGSETSKAAADSIKHIAPSIEREVLGYFLGHMGIPNGDGFTDDELETRMQRSHQTVSARRRGLEQKGLIEKTGLKRKTRSGRAAMVYKIIDGLTPDEIERRLQTKRMGRPKSDNPRSSRVTICFSQQEYNAIQSTADRQMVPVAQLLRQLIVERLLEIGTNGDILPTNPIESIGQID
ncbi:MAG: hypothetical protein GOVbin1773_10 [Prokaryotic dsDNA virus sp.]|jgi:hypothetical protein|nr:MAG: hypothetical protein GOVbin1773_10 [Prokaryotic dsDNA virus sp.]|tara:strand:- start:724 stop:1314 length:591 start_codon:yes stop_codon:yes gene_type:complete